jgi:Co-chaperone protein grpE
MKITPDLKAQILARHKAGDSQRKIQKTFNLSAGAVNKITKGVEQNLKSTINKGTQYLAELSDMNEYERETVAQVVSDNARALAFFKQTAVKNQIMANRLLKEARDLSDIELHSRITARNKETILGKNYDLGEQGATNALTQIIIKRDD